MASAEFQIGPTPNPNAVRVSLSTAVSPKPVTFSSAAQAEAHPLARKLFSVPGVVSLFMMSNFITVTKDGAADWESIEPKVAEILQAHYNG